VAAGLCQVCGKHTMFGRNIRHRHSGRWERKAPETPRTFRPNVHKQVINVDGVSVKLHICTRCLRTLAKVPKVRA
jgi:large subunit ribosomal protein L28